MLHVFRVSRECQDQKLIDKAQRVVPFRYVYVVYGLSGQEMSLAHIYNVLVTHYLDDRLRSVNVVL